MPSYEQRNWKKIPPTVLPSNHAYVYPSGERSLFFVEGLLFTPTQLELLYLFLGKKIPQREIARKKGIGFQTIQNNLQRFLHANNSIELTALQRKAHALGLFDPEIIERLRRIIISRTYKTFHSISLEQKRVLLGE